MKSKYRNFEDDIKSELAQIHFVLDQKLCSKQYDYVFQCVKNKIDEEDIEKIALDIYNDLCKDEKARLDKIKSWKLLLNDIREASEALNDAVRGIFQQQLIFI